MLYKEHTEVDLFGNEVFREMKTKKRPLRKPKRKDNKNEQKYTENKLPFR